MKKLTAAAAAVSLVGCASVMNEVTHGVLVDTKMTSGEVIQGAECVASNDYGSINFKSGINQALRRSSKDMDITCTTSGQPPAIGKVTSRANGGMAGNIVLGGVIGAVVDHNRGTAYTYPTWIELFFGQSLLFDRAYEKEGIVLKGTPSGTVQPTTSSGKRSNAMSSQCLMQLPGAVCP